MLWHVATTIAYPDAPQGLVRVPVVAGAQWLNSAHDEPGHCTLAIEVEFMEEDGGVPESSWRFERQVRVTEPIVTEQCQVTPQHSTAPHRSEALGGWQLALACHVMSCHACVCPQADTPTEWVVAAIQHRSSPAGSGP